MVVLLSCQYYKVICLTETNLLAETLGWVGWTTTFKIPIHHTHVNTCTCQCYSTNYG